MCCISSILSTEFCGLRTIANVELMALSVAELDDCRTAVNILPLMFYLAENVLIQ